MGIDKLTEKEKKLIEVWRKHCSNNKLLFQCIIAVVAVTFFCYRQGLNGNILAAIITTVVVSNLYFLLVHMFYTRKWLKIIDNLLEE